jgi:hypothetical protein
VALVLVRVPVPVLVPALVPVRVPVLARNRRDVPDPLRLPVPGSARPSSRR